MASNRMRLADGKPEEVYHPAKIACNKKKEMPGMAFSFRGHASGIDFSLIPFFFLVRRLFL